MCLEATSATLAQQMERPAPVADPPSMPAACDVPYRRLRRAAPVPTRRSLVMENGLGGFTPDGREYVIVLEGDRDTPLPWSNVLANPEFGTIVSSSGAAFTWAGNSRENRITPFANDPLADPTGEAIYLRDDDTGAVWGDDARADAAPPGQRPVGVRHAAGVTRFQHATNGLVQELARLRRAGRPGQASVLTLTNTSPTARGASACSGMSSGCLGPPRGEAAGSW